MTGAASSPVEAALVRVWRREVPVGAGFLAGPAHILTAAHVVATALGVPADGPRPEAAVEIDFPLLAPGRRYLADVVAWSAVAGDLTGDVAGLRPREAVPDGARPLVLARRRGLSDGQFVMVGFPHKLELGSWIYGRPGGPVSTGWVEILSDPARESQLNPGFSGSPVWYPDLDAAVGMVVRRVTGAAPKIGYLLPVDVLLTGWPELERVVTHAPPFRALRPFTEQDVALFFGREEQVEQLARQSGGASVVCLIGPSGVGKSSLLRAGLLPRLGAEPGVLTALMRPSDAGTPLRAMALALDGLDRRDGSPAERLARLDALAHRLAGAGQVGGDAAATGTADAVAAVLAARGAERLVLAVDQFEEVFGYPPAEQAAFTRTLRAAVRPSARLGVVLGLRDTFLGTSLRNPAVADLAARWLPATVAELSTSQLRRAITAPVARVGTVDYEPGLVDRLVQDVQSAPSPLPLLQFTLTELWEQRRGGLLTHEAYERLGGVRGALAGYAESVWNSLEPAARHAARRLLVQLTRPLPEGELSVRRTARRSELDDAQWTVAQRLATTRLLMLRAAPEPGVELAHESLLTRWERLGTFIDEARTFRLWQEALRQRMAQWSAERSAARRLLSGADLRDANRWDRMRREDLSAEERRYLSLSNRRRRRWVTGVAGALVLALVVVLVTYRTTGAQRREIAARDLATTAGRLTGYDSYGALQLAIRAYRTDHGVHLGATNDYGGIDRLLPNYGEARADSSAPQPSGSSGPASRLVVQDTANLSGRVSADGRTVLAADAAHHAVLWHLSGHPERDPAMDALFRPSDFARSLALSPSGRYAAFVQSLFPTFPTDIHAPVDEHGLPEPYPGVYPNCQPKSVTNVVTCLVVYDTQRHQPVLVAQAGGVFTNITQLSIDPTDQVLAAVTSGSVDVRDPRSAENTVTLWNLRTGTRRARLRLPWRSWISDLWLEPDGRGAVVRAFMPGPGRPEPDRLGLSYVDLGTVPSRVELAAEVASVAVSLDRRTVAAVVPGSGDLVRLRVWDAASRAVRASTPDLSADQSRADDAVALDATGTTLFLSWPGNFFQPSITDIQDTSRSSTRNVSVWRLPGSGAGPVLGAPTGQYAYDFVWNAMLPLGDGTAAAVLLLDTSTLGVVLSRAGREAPLSRLTAARDTGRGSAGDQIRRLCALLADPNNDQSVHQLVPRDAYQGVLCPS